MKKAEHQRIDAFELWCWRRLLRVPWTARRSNLSILKEISPGCSLEGMMVKLKLLYFGHLMRRVDSLEKTDVGRNWGQEEKGMTQDEMAGRHHRVDGCEFEYTPGVGDGQCREPAREFPPMTRSCGRALMGKASQDSRGTPWICLSAYPKTGICLFYYFTSFTNSSDIYGGLFPDHLSL